MSSFPLNNISLPEFEDLSLTTVNIGDSHTLVGVHDCFAIKDSPNYLKWIAFAQGKKDLWCVYLCENISHNDPNLEEIKQQSTILAIHAFINEFVIYDEEHDKVGLKMQLNDTLFINSGMKVALDTVLADKIGPNPSNAVNILRLLGIGVAGLYVNKSGKGNAGWDVRACLVDEDYAGFVHLSQAYTKELIEDGQNIVYCGDKLTQMMLIPVFHDEYVDIDEDDYNKIMANSKRGDKGFGSQDIKH